MTDEERREYDRARHKKYYEEHREEILNKCKEYREKNPELTTKRHALYYEEHREEILNKCKEYRAKNKEEIAKKGCIARKKENDESKEYASQHCHRWTPEEEEMLITMVSEGETYKDIAYTLRRTISSISSKIKKLRKAGIIE